MTDLGEGELVNILYHTQDVNAHSRQQAELHLHDLLQTARLPQTVSMLLNLAGRDGDSLPVHIRQLALIIVSQQIKLRYHEFPQSLVEAAIRFCLHVIADPSSNDTQIMNAPGNPMTQAMNNSGNTPPIIVSASINMLARLACHLKRHEFLDIISHFNNLLSSNPITRYQCNILKCIVQIMEDISDHQRIQITILIFQNARNIFIQYRSYTKAVRHIARIMTITCESYMTVISHGENIDDIAAEGCFEAVIKEWINLVFQWINESKNLQYTLNTELDVLLEILKSLPSALESIDFEEIYGSILGVCLSIINSVKDLHMAQQQHGTATTSSICEGYTSDGDRYDIHLLLKYSLDLMNNTLHLMEQPADALKLLTEAGYSSSSNVIVDLFFTLLDLSKLPAHSIEHFIHDGNIFILQEENDGLEISLRYSAAEMIWNICSYSLVSNITLLFQTASKSWQGIIDTWTHQDKQMSQVKQLHYYDHVLSLESVMWVIASFSQKYLRSITNSFNKISKAKKSEIILYQKTQELLTIMSQLEQLVISILSSFVAHLNQDSYDSIVAKSSILLYCRVLWVFSKYKSFFNSKLKCDIISYGIRMICDVDNHDGYVVKRSMPLAPKLIAIRAIGAIMRPHKSMLSPVLDNISMIANIELNTNLTVGLIEANISPIMRSCIQISLECDENTLHYTLETLDQLLMMILGESRSLLTSIVGLMEDESGFQQVDSMKIQTTYSDYVRRMEIFSKNASDLIHMCLNIWNKYHADGMIVDLIDSIFSHIHRIGLVSYQIQYYQLSAMETKHIDSIDINQNPSYLLSRIIFPYFQNILNYMIDHNQSIKSSNSKLYMNIYESCCNHIAVLLSIKFFGKRINQLIHHQYFIDFRVEMLRMVLIILSSNHQLQSESQIKLTTTFVGFANCILTSFSVQPKNWQSQHESYKSSWVPWTSTNEMNNFVKVCIDYAHQVIIALGNGGGTSNSFSDNESILESTNHSLSQALGPALGLVVHCALQYENDEITSTNPCILNLGKLVALMMYTINSVQHLYVKISLLMACIHILARRRELMNLSLSIVQSSQYEGTSSANIISSFIHLWCELHGTFSSRYCNRISTFGLLQLIKLHDQTDVNDSSVIISLLHVLFMRLPSVLQAEDMDDEDEATSHYDDEEVWSDDEDDVDNETDSTVRDIIMTHMTHKTPQNPFDQHDDDDLYESDSRQNGVFAPSEMYLSDMIQDSPSQRVGGDDDDYTAGLHIISDQLVFSPYQADPINSFPLQEVLARTIMSLIPTNEKGKANPSHFDCFVGLCVSFHVLGQLSYPIWFQSMPPDDMKLVEAILRSSIVQDIQR